MDNFKWEQYIQNYPDLKHITTKIGAWRHYQHFGKFENRTDEKYSNDVTLLSNFKLIDISDTFIKDSIKFYSSNLCIIKNKDGYNLIIRYVNYFINIHQPKIIFTLNKYVTMDSDFVITSEKIIENKCNIIQKYNGIEDIKLFEFNNEIYYIGNIFENNKSCITTNKFDGTFIKNVIHVNFTNNDNWEKNWCYFNFNNKLCLVYSWHPLKICEINNKCLDVLLIKDTPEIFKDLRGSTNGYIFNDEIWFICHTNIKGNYKHIFVIFDKFMNLKRYSEFFKFEGFKIEFCLGLIVEEQRIIISYSIYDNTSKIGIYDKVNLKFKVT